MTEAATNKFAKAIRSMTGGETEEFDLAGYDEAQAANLVKEAFSTPLACDRPCKVTFTIGGGRLVRARYSEDLFKWLGTALREVGFTEDRGAALGSQGAYKGQHDTDTNLKLLHVFPRVTSPTGATTSAGAGSGAPAAPTLDTSAPAYVLATCNFPQQFKALIDTKTVSYSQRRKALKTLQALLDTIVKCDEKMASLQPLTDIEQLQYDAFNRDELERRISWLSEHVKALVADGKVTSWEKEQLLAEAKDKLESLDKEIVKAQEAGKAKAVAALQERKSAFEAKHMALEDVSPLIHPVKYEPDIRKLRARLAPLLKIEAGTKGRLLTLAESKELAAKADIEDEIQYLCDASRCWFEDDAEFDARLKACTPATRTKGGKR